MRYGLQLVPQGAFPKELTVGLQLKKEAPIIVPEDCPECPESPPCVCTVEFTGWLFVQTADEFSTSWVVTCEEIFEYVVPPTSDPGSLESPAVAHTFGFPQGETCGHRMQFVFTPATSGGGVFVSNDLFWSYLVDAGGDLSGYAIIQTQIDLSDAEPGEETWTDFGCPIWIAGPAL